MTRSVVAALIAAAGLALGPAPGWAQCRPESDSPACQGVPGTPGWAGEVGLLGANALLGGVVAGVVQELKGGSFQDGFARGALGGAVIYAGKRIAIEDFDGAGLLGRETAAVGSSMVRNAADGRPTFSRLMLPFGPVRLYVEPGAPRPLQPKLDLAALAWTGYAVVEDRLEFDGRASLSAGAPVFRTHELALLTGSSDTAQAGGLSGGGVVLLADVSHWGRDYTESTFAHERVHVLQDDFVFLVASDPLEDWVLERIPGGPAVGRWVDLSLSNQILGVLGLVLRERDHKPWEVEADFLEGRR